jgi:hypothetical protein
MDRFPTRNVNAVQCKCQIEIENVSIFILSLAIFTHHDPYVSLINYNGKGPVESIHSDSKFEIITFRVSGINILHPSHDPLCTFSPRAIFWLAHVIAHKRTSRLALRQSMCRCWQLAHGRRCFRRAGRREDRHDRRSVRAYGPHRSCEYPGQWWQDRSCCGRKGA